MFILHIYLITQQNCNTYIFVFVIIPYMTGIQIYLVELQIIL